jgi:hypothetical protein
LTPERSLSHPLNRTAACCCHERVRCVTVPVRRRVSSARRRSTPRRTFHLHPVSTSAGLCSSTTVWVVSSSPGSSTATHARHCGGSRRRWSCSSVRATSISSRGYRPRPRAVASAASTRRSCSRWVWRADCTVRAARCSHGRTARRRRDERGSSGSSGRRCPSGRAPADTRRRAASCSSTTSSRPGRRSRSPHERSERLESSESSLSPRPAHRSSGSAPAPKVESDEARGAHLLPVLTCRHRSC